MKYESIDVDKGLRLVQLTPSQADVLFALTDNNREYLGEFLRWVPCVKTVDDSLHHIHETLENRKNNIKYTYGIEAGGEVVGDINLRNLQDDALPAEIGYWIAPEYSGKGFTTRAVSALTELGMNSLGLNKIIIRANPDNIASNRVAEKAGYIHVGSEVEDGETLNVWSISK